MSERAYIYTRKSRHLGDPDDPQLLAAHLATLARLAAADGLTVPPAQVYSEVGSGESITDRPVFAALLAEWEALPPQSGGAVYVMEPSRLSRGSNQERGRILDALIRARLKVVSPGRRYDPASPDDEMTWNVVQSIDRNENQRYKARVALKRAEMTRAGQILTGKPPRGWRWVKSPGHEGGKRVPGKLEADPDWFPIIQAVCREVKSTSLQRLGDKYGIHPASLRAVLHNPIICGYPARRHASHQGTRNWQSKYQPLPPEAWAWPEQPGDYPAACTRAEWEQIQAVLTERATRRLKTVFLDHGWAKAVVTFAGAPGRTRLGAVPLPPRGQVPTYEQERKGLPKLYVEREPVHRAALAALAGLFNAPGFLARLEQLVEEQERQANAPPTADLQCLRRQLDRERDRLANLKHEAADPDLDDEEREANLRAQEQCRARRTALKAELKQAQTPPPLPAPLEPLRPLLTELIAAFQTRWEQASGAERQEVLTLCVKEIPVIVTELGPRRYRREVGEPVLQEWWNSNQESA